jgi:uncharacterized repeat protein (TIGR02543 family)
MTSRDGYTFLGWFTAAEGGSLITASTTVATAEAHTLYAHWQAQAVPIDPPPTPVSGKAPTTPRTGDTAGLALLGASLLLAATGTLAVTRAKRRRTALA